MLFSQFIKSFMVYTMIFSGVTCSTAGCKVFDSNKKNVNIKENINRKPNIIVLYADDLGYGDIGCYGATHIPTPNLDRLASQGLLFTNGHSVAATCTPARYGLLTGSYPWRNKDARILSGQANLIIKPEMPTLPGMLRETGYVTGVVGKWHMGLGNGELDWNKEISPGPFEVGFDYSFIMPATNDRVPCVYIEGRNVVGLEPDDPIHIPKDQSSALKGIPTGKDNPELLRMKYSHGHDGVIINGISRIGYMSGGTAALWKDEEMAERFLDKAMSFVTGNADKPFFLYYAFHQPHVPRVPSPRFAGSTKLGPRGDVIAEMDWCVGEILSMLERLGLMENTMIIFSSDNGPVLDDGYEDQAASLNLKNNHYPAGSLRGGKYSLYDGGTRVPFIISWKGTIEPGQSSALVSHIDFFASLADLVGKPLASEAAPDSFNVLPALLGKSTVGREELVTEGSKTRILLYKGNWVFIPPYPGQSVSRNTNTESGNSPYPQLYNLEEDIGQHKNLAQEYASVIAEMTARLKEIQSSNRTR